jgi:drug/metabolite transporter (DMT)-like permease
MSFGQILFKIAAQQISARHASTKLLWLAYSPAFLVAVSLYAALTIVWVWILSFTPLSKAYTFVALAFPLTPILAGFVFGEVIDLTLIGGLTLICAGLLLIFRANP